MHHRVLFASFMAMATTTQLPRCNPARLYVKYLERLDSSTATLEAIIAAETRARPVPIEFPIRYLMTYGGAAYFGKIAGLQTKLLLKKAFKSSHENTVDLLKYLTPELLVLIFSSDIEIEYYLDAQIVDELDLKTKWLKGHNSARSELASAQFSDWISESTEHQPRRS